MFIIVVGGGHLCTVVAVIKFILWGVMACWWGGHRGHLLMGAGHCRLSLCVFVTIHLWAVVVGHALL